MKATKILLVRMEDALDSKKTRRLRDRGELKLELTDVTIGGGVALLTQGKQIQIPIDTLLEFRLEQPLGL